MAELVKVGYANVDGAEVTYRLNTQGITGAIYTRRCDSFCLGIHESAMHINVPSVALSSTIDAALTGWTPTTTGAGQWIAPGSNPVPNVWEVVMKTGDESKNNSAVVADDATLKMTLAANTTYSIRLVVFFLTNATADLKYRLAFTGTATRVRRRVTRTSTTDIAPITELKTIFDSTDVILTTTGLNPWLDEEVILQVGATGGIFKLQWAQVTANAGPTTCLRGSYIEYAVA